jgi:hypothetical protein
MLDSFFLIWERCCCVALCPTSDGLFCWYRVKEDLSIDGPVLDESIDCESTIQNKPVDVALDLIRSIDRSASNVTFYI